MHVYAIVAILISVLASQRPADGYILSALAPYTPIVHAPVTGSTPSSPSLSPKIKDGLELRQAPGFAPIAAQPSQTIAPATEPLVAAAPAPAIVMPPANQAVPPAPPAVVPVPTLGAMASIPLPALVTGDDFVTVQWVKTHIGTLATWVPNTETFHFEAMPQAPLPGVGSIGMGTLTGKTGQTQTILMVVGAAPTHAVELKKAIAAVVAVGFAVV